MSIQGGRRGTAGELRCLPAAVVKVHADAELVFRLSEQEVLREEQPSWHRSLGEQTCPEPVEDAAGGKEQLHQLG